MFKMSNKIAKSAIILLLSSSLYANGGEKVYAKVNGWAINEADVAMVLRGKNIQFDKLPLKTQKSIINQLIDRKLLALKALKSDVTNSNIYKQTLQKTIQALKQDLALQLWIDQELKKIKISDKEAKKYYDENNFMFKMPTRLKARHILVKTKQEANQLISQLKNSKDLQKDFINLAKEKSIGPSGKNGGDLGWFTPEKMVPAFSNAAMNLSKGQITLTPVKTQFGYHIIYLEDKQNAKTVSFDNVKEQIKQRLASEKFNQMLKDIVQKEKEKAKIEYKF